MGWGDRACAHVEYLDAHGSRRQAGTSNLVQPLRDATEPEAVRGGSPSTCTPFPVSCPPQCPKGEITGNGVRVCNWNVR